ncbi:DUF4253 domain-containing protein [Streptomyces sp. NPDC013433]|uniref:DUF4253 domain-containing protein n=1 Tax=Streptomyces sp. NPDC013433 TaxID=3155604 RepID=UPI003455240F
MNLESPLPQGLILPPGRMITSDEGHGTVQPLWLSDSPPCAGLWPRLRAKHAAFGLWPLLLTPLEPHETDFRPWACGELSPERMSSPADHDSRTVLARWWQDHTATDEDDDQRDAEKRLAVTAPFGQTWPGPAPATTPVKDADATADQYAQAFLDRHPHARLGLVAAPRGADALTTVGWQGPLNYDNDTATFSAVLRDWEDRFGTRVVGVGFATLHLSVAAPPHRPEDALRIAAEHFAFCPRQHLAGRPPRPGHLRREPHRPELLGLLVGLTRQTSRDPAQQRHTGVSTDPTGRRVGATISQALKQPRPQNRHGRADGRALSWIL